MHDLIQQISTLHRCLNYDRVTRNASQADTVINTIVFQHSCAEDTDIIFYGKMYLEIRSNITLFCDSSN